MKKFGKAILFIAMTLFFTGVIVYFALFFLLKERNIVEVPNVVGYDWNQARAVLQSRGLSLYKTRELTNERIPNGIILSQRPPAGIRIKSGERVEVIVSAGPKKLETPKVTSLNYRNAESVLRRLDLDVGRISRIYDTGSQYGTVLAQNPRAGETVPENTKVDLLVSLGKRPATYIFPDLRGLEKDTVLISLKKAGFYAIDVLYSASTIYKPNTIMRQSPKPYSFVTPDSSIILIVSKTLPPPETLLYGMNIVDYTVSPGLLSKDVSIALTDQIRRRYIVNGKFFPFDKIEKVVIYKRPAVVYIYENNILKEVEKWN